MTALVTCLTVQHSHFTVLIALLVALTGGFLTMSLMERVRGAGGSQFAIWLFLAGFVGGVTAWSTHFIAMLGYVVDVPHAYDRVLTFVSLAVAICTTVFAIFVAFAARGSALVEAAGVVFGFGVALMHFVGMRGFKVAGYMEWSVASIVWALALGSVFGALCFSVCLRAKMKRPEWLAALLFALSVFSIHFISMAGLSIVPASGIVLSGADLPSRTMVFVTLQVTSIVLILGVSILILDSKTREGFDERILQASARDALTGLSNRVGFNEQFALFFERARARHRQLAVIHLDISRFKQINDVHGHLAGDYVLRVMTSRLSSCLGSADFLARVGSDEFALVVEAYNYRSDALRLMRRVAAEFDKPIDWSGKQISVDFRAGIAIFPADGLEPDELIARADAALLRAKRSASERTLFYDARQDHHERRRNALAFDMRRSLQEGEFELFYQQQHLTDDRSIFGFEVLLRWFHKELGFVPPDEFIPIAEQTGFIMELGEWVLREACMNAVSWKKPYQVGVNVAPLQLADERLPAKVKAILEESGLPPQRLELEITETGIIADYNRALAVITELKRLGVKVAMDDFGTGNSSLRTLQQFPFDKIKVDRSFVSGLPDDQLSAAILRATVIIGESLGTRVLAEGVETDEQLAFLLRENCMRAQGYLFGRPKPFEEIRSLVMAED
ncbi:EAL domain-containing protein [Martelella alba]|uniref:EAL domain-containing protein n=1 Tax=Martelella alba TaxID=2590451 RepID=A0A506UE97_9HYPH|nr:EAL domain-containing protein [Martelella alba]TPW31736.1 EAL domain-containing protein [Martelella alba]